jgi:hypothetical protein
VNAGRPPTRRRAPTSRWRGREKPAYQRGQAIVLIAIMLAVVVGMAALAIDGSRAYAVRRDLQAAVDAAALAAADSFQQNGSYIPAEQAASTIFGTNLRLYASPSCSPGYAAPAGGSSVTVGPCTYSDGTVLTQVVSALGPQGSQFTMTATRSLSLQFGRILTNGATPQLSANGSGNVNNLLFSPTLASLNQAGCGGTPGISLSIEGAGPMQVVGDVVSSGAISAADPTQVAGDVYARCQSSISNVTTNCYPNSATPPCSSPNVAGAVRSGFRFVDPNYPAPTVAGGSQPSPGNKVELSPGTFAANPNIAAGKCYFLATGVYRWQNGYTSNGGFVSNELKPPDEPSPTNNTLPAGTQFWNTNGVNCAGAFRVTAIGGSVLPSGTWAVVLTSLRTDVYNGTSYQRESAPSMCRALSVSPGQLVSLDISNVPGATSYNIYLAPPPNGCAGPFGLVGQISVVGAVQNNNTPPCPAFTSGACSLGYENIIVDSTLFGGLPFVPNALAAPGTFEAYPPDRETSPLLSGLPNQNANRANPPAGDRANENECMTSGGALSSCPAPITPGAVAFTFPSGVCLNNTSTSDTYVYSGYQYNWLVVHQPPGSGCSNTLGAAGNSAYIGLVYTPSASLSLPTSAMFRSRATGGMIADSMTFTVSLPSIVGSLNYMPSPPSARLTG